MIRLPENGYIRAIRELREVTFNSLFARSVVEKHIERNIRSGIWRDGIRVGDGASSAHKNSGQGFVATGLQGGWRAVGWR